MWARIKAFFHGSEVIAWSRLQVIGFTLWVALQGVDISPVVKDPKWLMYWAILSNVVNEMLRRRHAERDDDGNLK